MSRWTPGAACIVLCLVACKQSGNQADGDPSGDAGGGSDGDITTETDDTGSPLVPTYGPHGALEVGDATAAVYGAGPYENAGTAVLWVDADGDGDDDLVALADQATDPELGPPYLGVWDVLPSGKNTFVDSAWTMNNDLPVAESRIRWMGSGDLSDDGQDDLIVERTLPGGGTEVVLLAGPLTNVRSLGQQTAQVVFESQGEAVHWATIPDVTGDGIEDLLAGDPLYNGLAEDSGQAWVFAGPLQGRREEDLAYATLQGNVPREAIGSALAATDTNGDGIGDVVLAAVTEHVYVLWGPIQGTSIAQIAYDARWTYDPNDAEASSVYTAPVWVGDATGDGHADMLFGSQDLRLIEGPLSGEVDEDDVRFTLPGATSFSVGDANADGEMDLLVGDGAYNPGVSAEEGIAFLYYGPMSGGLGETDATFHATGAVDRLGAAVALGDGDGDGYADSAIGVPGFDAGGVEAGAVLIFRGGI